MSLSQLKRIDTFVPRVVELLTNVNINNCGILLWKKTFIDDEV